MAIQNKRPPVINDSSRALRQVYDDINEIINSVNQVVNNTDDTKGKPGDLRVRKDSSSKVSTVKHNLEFRSSDGWDRAVTMPRNPNDKAMLIYNSDISNFEWASGDEIGEGSRGSPYYNWKLFTSDTVGKNTSIPLNVVPSASGGNSKGVMVAGTSVVGGKGVVTNRLKALDVSGTSDVEITTNLNEATMQVTGASKGTGFKIMEGSTPGTP